MARDNQKGIFYHWLYRHKSILVVTQHHKTHVNCSFNQNRFIITIITEITWVTRHALSVDEKSTKERECTTEVA